MSGDGDNIEIHRVAWLLTTASTHLGSKLAPVAELKQYLDEKSEDSIVLAVLSGLIATVTEGERGGAASV